VNSPRRILIAPGNTDLNRGDQALMWASIDVARQAWPGVEVFVYRTGATSTETELQMGQTHGRVTGSIPRILPHPSRIRRSARADGRYDILTLASWTAVAVADLLASSTLLSRHRWIRSVGEKLLNGERRMAFQLFRSVDALVIKGGGFLHAGKGYAELYKMYYLVYDILLAKRHKVPVFILPNSFGPVDSSWGERLLMHALRSATYLATRESVSHEYLTRLGLRDVEAATDLALREPKDHIQPGRRAGKRIAVTARPDRSLPDGGVSYYTALATTIVALSERGWSVDLVPHTLGPGKNEDDRGALTEVASQVRTAGVEVRIRDTEGFNCTEMERLYAEYDMLIGTRFHSVLFAWNVGVPAIAIAYGGNKALGIMDDAGLASFVVPITEVTSDRLLDMVTDLARERDAYKNSIRAYMTKHGGTTDRLAGNMARLWRNFQLADGPSYRQ